MIDPTTFNTDKDWFGSRVVKNWLGIGAIPGPFEETPEHRRIRRVLALMPLQFEDARLRIDAGSGCASPVNTLEQVSPDRVADGLLECSAADPGPIDEFPIPDLVLLTNRPAVAVTPHEPEVDGVAHEAHDATGEMGQDDIEEQAKESESPNPTHLLGSA
jgi:hypothetical protein